MNRNTLAVRAQFVAPASSRLHLQARKAGRDAGATLVLLLACTFVQAADYPAVLDWAQRLEVSAPVSGVVEQVQVMPGQVVRSGDILLTLDATPFKADLAEARAEQERATADEADARRDLERAEELYRRTVSPTTELDAARLRHARAQAALAAAQARLERRRWQLAQAEVRAPYTAVVLERRAEPGMTVAAQCQPPVLLRLAAADRLVARARLTPEQAAGLAPGSEVEVLVAGAIHPAKVSALLYDGQGATPYAVEATLPRSPDLFAGQPASLRLR